MNDEDEQLLENVIEELEKEGADINDPNMIGMGDVVKGVFEKFGITEERFKKWTGKKRCGCLKRQQWLNKLIPFSKGGFFSRWFGWFLGK